MPGVRVQWVGWRGPSGRFQAEAPADVASTLGVLGTSLLVTTRQEAPISDPGSHDPRAGTRPGRLREQLRTHLAPHGQAGGVLTLESAAPHTQFVLRGRGEIVAPAGRTLRFWAQGRLMFRKRVGPVKPNPFLERAFARWRPIAQGALRQMTARWAARLLDD
jgi:hypothetical protein